MEIICLECGSPVRQTAGGRPRLYCSNSCRQAAHRRRQAACGLFPADSLEPLGHEHDILPPPAPTEDQVACAILEAQAVAGAFRRLGRRPAHSCTGAARRRQGPHRGLRLLLPRLEAERRRWRSAETRGRSSMGQRWRAPDARTWRDPDALGRANHTIEGELRRKRVQRAHGEGRYQAAEDRPAGPAPPIGLPLLTDGGTVPGSDPAWQASQGPTSSKDGVRAAPQRRRE